MHTALIKSSTSTRQQKRVMCTGFVSKGSVDAWSASNLAGYDIDNCEYYLIKKLPIVAYATVQMQSNAIQLAGGTAPVTPVTPVDPIACTAPQASLTASVQRTTLQTYVTPEEYNAKLAQVPTPLLTMQTQTAIAMGAPVAVVLFCAANPIFCIGSAIIASCAATPACMDAAVKAGGAVLNAVVNAFTPVVSQPPNDPCRDETKAKSTAKTKAQQLGGCFLTKTIPRNLSKTEIQARIDAYTDLANARDTENACFAKNIPDKADQNHIDESNKDRIVVEKCKGLL